MVITELATYQAYKDVQILIIADTFENKSKRNGKQYVPRIEQREQRNIQQWKIIGNIYGARPTTDRTTENQNCTN